MLMKTSLAAALLLAFPQEPPPYDLEKVEYAERLKKAPDEVRKLLARNGFVVAEGPLKQIFEVYLQEGFPHFITPDSAWHTYHVLLEEGVRTLSEVEAGTLKNFSARLVKAALEGRDPADRDLARFAAAGLAFQDPDAVDPALQGEARAVRDALEGQSGPVRVLFFGLPLLSERFRPAGFYTQSPALKACFAARQWYALADFRAKSPEEISRAARLALLVEGDRELAALYARLTEPYEALLGPAEDGDVPRMAALARKAGPGAKPADLARAAQAALPAPAINDQALTPAQYANFADEIRGFRLLPPRRVASSVLFQNVVDPAVKGRMFPSGLDFAAAGPLASEASRRALRGESPEHAEAILRAKAPALGDSLHDRALKLLRILQEPLPETAPAPCRTAAWRDLQLWTQLGAWAELQHTWALHAKLSAHFFGLTRPEPGRVAPYPRFFEELGRLATDTAAALGRHWPDGPMDTRLCGMKMHEVIDLVGRLTDRKATEADSKELERYDSFLRAYLEKAGTDSKEKMMERMNALRPLAVKLKEGGELTAEERALARLIDGGRDVPSLLREFGGLCGQLAPLAASAREGKDPDEEGARLIQSYGKRIARFHFYEGNSWLVPRDDFPKIAPVFMSPGTGQILYAGVARPEPLFVIVRSGGKDVLHRGAVLSYRELRRASDRPLDDEAWRSEVRSGAAPPPPAFTESFRKR